MFILAYQHIRMISEGSCDTEDWNNNAENSALITEINYILQYIHKETVVLHLLFLLFTASIKYFVQKHGKTCCPQTSEWYCVYIIL